MGMVKEFKDFAMRGNVMDMAIGIIIGVAFGKIVTSLVQDIIMPPLGLLIGGVDFTDMGVTLKNAVGEVPAVVFSYGKFIQTIFDFLIVAIAIFFVIKGMNSLKRKQPEAPAQPPAPPQQEVLLGEIRDLLKKQTGLA